MRVAQAYPARSLVSVIWAVALVACAPSSSDVAATQLLSQAEHRRAGYGPDGTCDPGPDSDGDGVPNWRDQCPYELERYNGYEDDDGCPDHRYITLRETRPEITNQLCFSVGSAELSGNEDNTLEGIASRLRRFSVTMRLVEIGGHADEQEPDGWELSLRRADSVLCRLTRFGVDRKRLFARRYRAQPGGAKAATSRCGSNRRVDFSVIEYGNVL